MAVEPSLPVFSFRPNLREPISERLSFLTDILRSATGAEQRRSLRETPRRSFEADFLLTGAERTFWDLFVGRLGGSDILVPLYWEVVSVALSGGSDRIWFDTTSREWPYFEGNYALLVGKDAFDYEVVQVAGVDSSGIDLTEAVLKSWSGGTKLYPLCPAVIEDYGDLSHKSAAVGLATARFRLIGGNFWTPGAEGSPSYEGLPVLLSESNWVEDLTTTLARDLAILDTNIGRTFQVDSLARAFDVQAHRWFLPGRSTLASFRDLLYRHRGRSGAFWFPTFKADFMLADAIDSSDTTIEVDNVGFLYTGGQTAGREHIVIRHSAGTIFRQIVDTIPGTTSATEKLVLDSPVGLDLAVGQVRKISFMDTCRFDADDFEIVHHAGIDGLHECSTAVRAFSDTRSSPTPIDYPIPVLAKNPAPCGGPIYDPIDLASVFPIVEQGNPNYPAPGTDYPASIVLGPYPSAVSIRATTSIMADDFFVVNGVVFQPEGEAAGTKPSGTVLATLAAGSVVTLTIRNSFPTISGATGTIQAVAI